MINSFNYKKSLGQHFLVNENIIKLIIQQSTNLESKTVIEIGPGNLALTKELVLQAHKVIALEIDKRLEIGLEGLKSQYDNFDYIIQNALYFDYSDLKDNNKVIISNLPYNTGTKIYLSLLYSQNKFDYFILMFQLEVAKKIVAKVKDKEYCKLSIISNLLSNNKILFEVDKNNFFPQPSVCSAVVKITPLEKPRYNVSLTQLDQVLSLAFQGKRKTIKNSLRKYKINFSLLNIDENKRAQEITTEEFCKITNYIDNKL